MLAQGAVCEKLAIPGQSHIIHAQQERLELERPGEGRLVRAGDRRRDTVLHRPTRDSSGRGASLVRSMSEPAREAEERRLSQALGTMEEYKDQRGGSV